MKRLSYFLVSMLTAAIAIVGCTEDITTDEIIHEGSGNVKTEFMEVSASLECEDSRTTLTDGGNGGKVLWSETDAIGAISEDGTITECVATAVDGTKATFNVPTDTKYAIYPFVADMAFDKSAKTLNYTLPSEVTLDGSKKVFGDKQNVMCAHLTSGNLPFRNLCGYVEVKLKGSQTVKHVALRNNSHNWDALSGLGTISFEDANEPKITTGTNHGTTFNFAYAVCSDVKLSGEATSFYFIVPPRTYENLSICVQTDKGSYSTIIQEPIKVNRSMICPFEAIDLDTITPTGITSLSEGGVANCYIVPQGSEAKYY